MVDNSIENQIKDIIHNLITTETGIYSCLCFSELKKIQDFEFSFNFNYNQNELIEDVKFFIDNIISKIFEINYDVDYRKTSRLGGTITCNGIETKNHFIINDYEITEEMNISSLEDYLEDIKVTKANERYTIYLKLPIYELDKAKIIVS